MNFYIHKIAFKFPGLFCFAFMLASCASAPSQTYDLSPLQSPYSRSNGSGQIIIYEPNVIALYDTQRIVVQGINQGYTYLPQAQWSDRLPRLVQTRLIQSFENSSRYKTVGRPTDHINAGALLTTDIRKFEINEQTREAVVEISVKLVNQGTGRVNNTNVFVSRVPVSMIDGGGASSALDEALRNTLTQIVGWAR